MTIPEILLIGVGLSMDAVAVSMINGMAYGRISKVKCMAIPLFFGFFQGFMPAVGFFAGGFFAEIIAKYAGFLIFAILGGIGIKMIKEGLAFSKENFSRSSFAFLAWMTIFFQAVATSLDAFAVGIGFSAAGVDILLAAPLIAVITMVLSTIAFFTGRKSGDVQGGKAEALGGLILIIIGIKAVL